MLLALALLLGLLSVMPCSLGVSAPFDASWMLLHVLFAPFLPSEQLASADRGSFLVFCPNTLDTQSNCDVLFFVIDSRTRAIASMIGE